MNVDVVTLRYGSFSGTGPSVVDALRSEAAVYDIDLLRRSDPRRDGRARLAAALEGRRYGVPWSRTGAWRAHLAARADEALRTARSVRRFDLALVLQTVVDMPRQPFPYVVHTDRVGLEGAANPSAHRSRFSPGWLAREQALLRDALHVFTFGPSTAEWLVGAYGLPAARVHVVGSGQNTPAGRLERRTSLRRLVFVGTQWELKGGPEIVRAIELVRAEGCALELTVVGCSPPVTHPWVHVVGRVPRERVSHYLMDADVSVLHSHIEAFGIAIVESLAHGLPCIVSDVGNQAAIIGDAGIAVPPGDVSQLAEALRSISRSYADYADRAFQKAPAVRAWYRWERVVSDILDVTGFSPARGARATDASAL